jgi:hypothetical protein
MKPFWIVVIFLVVYGLFSMKSKAAELGSAPISAAVNER